MDKKKRKVLVLVDGSIDEYGRKRSSEERKR